MLLLSPNISASSCDLYSPVWVEVEEITTLLFSFSRKKEMALTPVVVKSAAAFVSLLSWLVESVAVVVKLFGIIWV